MAGTPARKVGLEGGSGGRELKLLGDVRCLRGGGTLGASTYAAVELRRRWR